MTVIAEVLGWAAGGLVAAGVTGWLVLARRCRTRRAYAVVTRLADIVMTAGLVSTVTGCALYRLWVATGLFAVVAAWYLRVAWRWRRRRRRLAAFAAKMNAEAHLAPLRATQDQARAASPSPAGAGDQESAGAPDDAPPPRAGQLAPRGGSPAPPRDGQPPPVSPRAGPHAAGWGRRGTSPAPDA
jgi:hypothetical protein